MSVIEQVVQGGLKLSIEFLEVGILVDVKVEKVAEDVMKVLEFEVVKAFVQCLQHLMGGH